MQELHMNAVKVKEKQLIKLDTSQYIMEEKFKGIRCWRIKYPNRSVKLITRGGEDITRNFPHLVDFDWTPSVSSSQLDCELYDPEQEDEVVSGWANRISIDPSHTEGCILKAFGVLNLNGTDLASLPEIERKRILSSLKLRGPIEEVPYHTSEKHREFYEYIISTSNKYGKLGEGIMLKNIHATYLGGVRQVGRWLKRKKRDPYDCVILGFTKAKDGKFFGLIGAVTVGQFFNGIIRPICEVSGMSDEVRKDMTMFPEVYVGKACSIWAADQDKKSFALIEPSWHSLRIDKHPSECIYQNSEGISEDERMIEL